MSQSIALKDRMSSVVMPGETIVWSADAPAGLRLRAADAFLIPFSVMWGGFALVWESTVIVSGAPMFFRLWGIPFVVVGLYLMLGRFFIDAYLREQTAYAITDRAVYIARVADFPVTRRFAGSALDSVTLDSRSGAIRLAPAPPLFAPNGFAIWHDARLDVLEGLADARRVLQLVIAARDAAPDRDGRRTAAT